MLTKKSYHKFVACRIIPELAAVDPEQAHAIIQEAHQRIPFKSIRNWWVVLICIMYSLPFVSMIFFHEIQEYFTISESVFFLLFMMVSMGFHFMSDLFYVRIIRPDVLEQLQAQ